ncbi:MAG: hypothetical protein HY721_16270 [Planctomycetes bacterium]|nr:hypothetical protein [Planctomycetota bacterium]
MRKLITVLISAFAGVVITVAFLGVPVGVRAGGGPLATRNGDVNCDGRINIADPIFLLQWLFDRGRDPCAFAQEGDPSCTAVLQALEELKQDLARTRPCWPPGPEDRVYLAGQGQEDEPGVRA